MSPDQIRNLVLGYTGGVGSAANDLVNMTYSLYSEGRANPNKIPVVSSFYAESQPGYYIRRLYDMKKDFDRQWEEYQSDKKTGRAAEYASEYVNYLNVKGINVLLGSKEMDAAREKEMQRIIEIWDAHEKTLNRMKVEDLLNPKSREQRQLDVENVAKYYVKEIEKSEKEWREERGK